MDYYLGIGKTLITQMRHNYRLGIVYWFIIILLMADSAKAYQTCSWIGSQINTLNEDHVRVVRLDCDRGQVSWRYSRGALVVHIQAPNFDPIEHSSARICYRLSKTHQNVLLYDMQESSGLSLLFDHPETSDNSHVTCKPLPKNGLVNLFVELHKQHSRSVQNSRASFYYEIFRTTEPTPFDEAKIRRADIFTSKSCTLKKSSYFVNVKEYLGRSYLSCLIEWEKFRKMLERTRNSRNESYCTNLEF